MNLRWLRLFVALPWRVAALVCLISLVVLVSTTWSAEARFAQFQPPPPPSDTPEPPPTDTPGPPPPPTDTPGPPPPPTATGAPPPPPNTPLPGQEPVVKYKGTAQPPQGSAPTKFVINGCAVVVRPPNLSLSEEPGFGQAHVQAVDVGQQVAVLAGPIGSDSLWWWQFRSPEGRVGWGVGDYADPSAGPCAAAGPSATATAVGVAHAKNLPATGVGSQWLIPALALAVLLIVAAVVRRRRPQVASARPSTLEQMAPPLIKTGACDVIQHQESLRKRSPGEPDDH